MPPRYNVRMYNIRVIVHTRAYCCAPERKNKRVALVAQKDYRFGRGAEENECVRVWGGEKAFRRGADRIIDTHTHIYICKYIKDEYIM